jgi:hypothetical protein
VWILAGHELPPEWDWKEVRHHRDPKEAYFVPFAKVKKVSSFLPGRGRRQLSQEAARHFDRIRQRCPEDVGELENRLRQWLIGGRLPTWSCVPVPCGS